VAQLTNRNPIGFEAQTKKPSRWFWDPNHQIEAAGFEAQTGKPSTTLVLRFNQETHHRFWDQSKRNVTTSFEDKLEKTVTAGFEAKPPETIAVGFEAKMLETVTTSFEDKSVKTVWAVLRPNHSQTVAIGFVAQTDEKPSEWFWGQTTHKPLTLVLRLNQETYTPHLHVHGADRTWRHPTSRAPGHRVPDMCDHPRSSAPGLLPQFSSLRAMPHLPPAHHETSKRDSPNETKIKEKQNDVIPDSNSNLSSQWLITIKLRNRPPDFSISPLMSQLTTKEQSLKFESKTPWSTARWPKKTRKAQECHLEEGQPQKARKAAKPNKMIKKS
jgi:hypothetical protein